MIVGGGPVGALAAVLLGEQGRSVVLVERTRPERQAGRLGCDLRNVALSPGSRVLLQRAHVWDHLNPAPYRKMCVWEERGTGQLGIDASEVGRPELGWICENSELACALWRVLETSPSVELKVGEAVDSVVIEDHQVALTLPSGTVSGRLLVGADGHRSVVRTRLDVPVRQWPTGHHALATAIRVSSGHGNVAWQKFLLDGPLAVLPSGDSRVASVVWSQSPSEAARRRIQPEAEFCAELTAQLESRLGVVEAVDERLLFPINQQLAESFNPRHRVVLIGDAARAIHPLAGLGVNVGFEDVRDLVLQAGSASAADDLGEPGRWTNFARKRRARSQMMLQLMTALRLVYSVAGPLPALLRNVGVGWLDRSALIKRQIAFEAMGLGPLARLA